MFVHMIYRKDLRWLVLLSLSIIFLNVQECATRTTTTSLTTTITTLKCSANLDMNKSIIKLHESDWSQYLNIRCSANFPVNSNDGFTHPVFDLSFGDTSNSGLYIVRGESTCWSNNTECSSQFKVSGQALQKLLLPSMSMTKKDEVNEKKSTMMTNLNERMMNHASSVIKVTCDVADTSRNSKLIVRCTDSGTIRFAKVLKYNELCAVNSVVEECDQQMYCVSRNGAHRCHCKKGLISHVLSGDQVVCIEPASINQKCVFTKQCTTKNIDSLCEFDTQLQYKICKCLSGFEEIFQNGSFSCQKFISSTRSKSSMALNGQMLAEDFDTNNRAKQISNNENMSQTKSIDGISWIVFGIVLVLAMITILIIIGAQKRGKMKIVDGKKNDNQNDEKNINALNNKNQQSDDEEIEIRIDDAVDESKLIMSGRHPVILGADNSISNTTNPNQPINHGSSFHLNIKQSVV